MSRADELRGLVEAEVAEMREHAKGTVTTHYEEGRVAEKLRCVSRLEAILARTEAAQAWDGAVGEVIEGFSDAFGGAAHVARWTGKAPPIGTKLYTHPQDASAITEVTWKDAPMHYAHTEAGAWASGYNTAMSAKGKGDE